MGKLGRLLMIYLVPGSFPGQVRELPEVYIPPQVEYPWYKYTYPDGIIYLYVTGCLGSLFNK